VDDKEIICDSILPKDQIRNVMFETGGEYMTETLPTEMDENRTVTEYKQFLFERKCKPISAKVNHYYELENNDRILFM
jgi:CRISPR-associated protein Cas5h